MQVGNVRLTNLQILNASEILFGWYHRWPLPNSETAGKLEAQSGNVDCYKLYCFQNEREFAKRDRDTS
jgi:hypothetical protein